MARSEGLASAIIVPSVGAFNKSDWIYVSPRPICPGDRRHVRMPSAEEHFAKATPRCFLFEGWRHDRSGYNVTNLNVS